MSQLIYKKMNQVMADIGAVSKDQKNVAQGFKFRGIDQFVNALYPALVKHGVFMTTEVINQTQELKEVTRSNGKAGVDKHVTIQMKYTFFAEDGSSVSSSIPAEGVDSGDKATNKALSAALKYALIQTFSIPTTDMAEADFESPELGVTRKGQPEQAAPEKLHLAAAPAAATEPLTEPVKKTSSFRKPNGKAPSPVPTIAPATSNTATDWE